MILERVSAVLEAIGAPFALIGGQAVVLRGYARTTMDYDFLTTDPAVMRRDVWAALEREGAHVDVRRGDQFDPVAGVVHVDFMDRRDADVILAKWKWEAEVIERAERMNIRGLQIRVPTTSDLILLKLSAGGPHDLNDVSLLLEAGDRPSIVREVDERIGALDGDARDAWQRFRDSR